MNTLRRTALVLLLVAACSKDPGGNPECDSPADCTAPGPCQVAAGASCVSGRCEYAAVADDTGCDDGDPCTAGDRCSAGACTTVAIPDGEACEGASGVCAGGACVECVGAGDCDDDNACTEDACGTGHACSHTVLVDAACDDADACTYADSCGADAACGGTLVVCESDVGVCGAARTCNGTAACTETYPGTEEPCDDGAACTFGDRCDGAGACGGTAITCTSDAGPCGAVRSCDGTATCAVSFAGTTTSCDDGQACTHADRCDGAGGCGGTAITCTSDAGPCGAIRTCDGTPACAVSFPDLTTACDDGAACTHTDRCDGAGGCGGTAIVCSNDPGPCGMIRTCDGTPTCDTSYPRAETSCDDGASCTHTDRCDGAGGCGGTALSCTSDPGPCGLVRTCNGTPSCATAYPSTATACDDGQACTHTDRCDGAGGCGGTALSCTSDPGPCGLVRTCNGTASCASTFPDGSVACDDGRACSITDLCDGAGGCSGWPLMTNQAPLPMVDSDVTGVPGNALSLDASHAVDPDAWCGDAVVRYEWDLDGDGVFELQPAGAVATLTWAQLSPYGFSIADPSAGWEPAYDAAVRVTDQWGTAGVQPVTLRICNSGPVAVPTVTPATAACGVSMVFDGSGSYSREFSGRRLVSYRWDLDVAVDSSGNGNPADDFDAAGPRITHRYTRMATTGSGATLQIVPHRARLTVTDDSGATGFADVDATLSFANRAPVADAGGPYSASEAFPVNLDGSGSNDPDQPCDGVVAWRWDTDADDLYGNDDVNGSVLCGAKDCEGRVIARAFDPGWRAGRTVAVRLVVEDAYGQRSPPAASTIEVVAPPPLPAVVLLSPAGGEFLRGVASVQLKLSHPLGMPLTLELRLNGSPIAFNGSSAVNPPADGSQVNVVRTFDTSTFGNGKDTYTLQVIAKVTASPTVLGQAASRAPFSIDNGAPTVTLPAGESAPVLELVALDGTPFTFHPTVTDGLDPAPQLTASPVLVRYPLGTTRVSFTASDWAGNVTVRNVDVRVQDTTPPMVTLPDPGVLTARVMDPRGARGQFWLPDPIASDLGTSTASLVASTRVWMTLRNAAGSAVPPPVGGYLLRDPQYADLYFPPGDTTVRYRVTDGSGNYGETNLTVTVVQ